MTGRIRRSLAILGLIAAVAALWGLIAPAADGTASAAAPLQAFNAGDAVIRRANEPLIVVNHKIDNLIGGDIWCWIS